MRQLGARRFDFDLQTGAARFLPDPERSLDGGAIRHAVRSAGFEPLSLSLAARGRPVPAGAAGGPASDLVLQVADRDDLHLPLSFEGAPAHLRDRLEGWARRSSPPRVVVVGHLGATDQDPALLRVATARTAGAGVATNERDTGDDVVSGGDAGEPAGDANRGTILAEGLDDPAALALLPTGVAVTEAGAGRVVLLGEDGAVQGRLGGNVLRRPEGAAVAPDGSLLVSDGLENRIYRLDPDGGTHRGFGTGDGDESRLEGAGPLAIGPAGTVAALDIDASRILMFDSEGAFVRAVGREGTFGEPSPGRLYFPGGLAFLPDGRLLVSDTHHFAVQVFGQDGEPEGMWGRQGTGAGEFDHPFGIAVDAARGRVYVVDDQVKLASGANRVEVLDLQGRPLGWLAPAQDQPSLRHPFDVAVDPAGRVLVTDRSAGRVWRFPASAMTPYSGG